MLLMNKLVCLVFILIFWSGCSREASMSKFAASESSEQKKLVVKTSNKLAETSVLIQWGTNQLTVADVNRMVDLRAKMISLSMPTDKSITRDEALVAQTLAAAPYWYPREQALAMFAVTNGIAVEDALVSKMRKRSMLSAKNQFTSWLNFLKKFTEEERQTLEKRIAIESTAEAVRIWHEKNYPCSLSADEIAKYRTRQRAYNERAAATNALIFAQATNICRQLASGLSFEAAVNQYSTDEGEAEGGEWGDFNIDDFKDEPQLKAVVASLKPGDISEPVEGDGGLMIVKLNDYVKDVNGETRLSLSRIFLHLPEFYPELDDQAFAAELKTARQNRMFTEFVKRLVDVSPPIFPNGDSMFEDARKAAENPIIF